MTKSSPSQSHPSRHTSSPDTQNTDPNLIAGTKRPSQLVFRPRFALRVGAGHLPIFLPKFEGPLAGTSVPSVLPWNRIGSWPGPAQYPNVQTEVIVLSS